MSDIIFKRGEFQAFRALSRVHIGKYEFNIEEGEVVEFDGQTIRRGQDEQRLPTLRAAIKSGWLVPEDQEGGEYIARPAGIQVHSAQQTTQSRTSRDGAHFMGTVEDEEQEVGTLTAHQEKKAAANAVGATRQRIVDEHNQEAEVIGGSIFKTSAKNTPVEIGKSDRAVVSKLDTQTRSPLQTRKTSSATGSRDIENSAEDRAAALAAERRRQAVEAARKVDPEIKEPVSVAPGMSSVGDASDGEVVGSVSKEAGDIEDPVTDDAIVQAKIEVIRSFVPGFDWDMSEHWKTRVKKALEHKDSMPVLNAILSIETDTVKKHVMQGLYG